LAKFLATAASVCLVGSTTVPILPAFAASIDSKTAQKQAEFPTCGHKIGTLAVREPDTRWWEGLGLESPEALLKVFVMKSGCFTLVDRGKLLKWRNRNAPWLPVEPCRAAPISAPARSAPQTISWCPTSPPRKAIPAVPM